MACLLACAKPSPPLPEEPSLPRPAPVEIEPVASSPEIRPEGTGIPICDEYLDLYARCEEQLMPEIMAGNRRFHHAEEASIRYHAGTPEAASLPGACQRMLDALKVDCPES